MVRIVISGDVVNLFSQRQFVDDELGKILRESDYAVCNFEGPICSSSKILEGKLRQQDSTVASLKKAGFDLLLLANNHIADYGELGLAESIRTIEENGLEHIGAGFSVDEVYAPLIKEIKGVIFGFVNLAQGQTGYYARGDQSYGYAWFGYPAVKKLILETRRKVDRLILCVHAGLEHFDIPIAEYRNLYRSYCDLGVDCVVGAHPHVCQGVESYKGSLICYSIGNFYFPRNPAAGDDNIENHAFSLILHAEKTGHVNYELLFHKVCGQKVFRVQEDESMLDIGGLNRKLESPLYDYLLKELYRNAWERYKTAFRYIFAGTDQADSMVTGIKLIVKYLFGRKKYYARTQKKREALLLQIMRSETARYVIENALTEQYNETHFSNQT